MIWNWHSSLTEGIGLYPEKSHRSDLICLYCGTTGTEIVKNGKINCNHCIQTFRDYLHPYWRRRESRFPFEKKKFLKRIQNLNGLDGILQNKGSVRLRFARNLKKYLIQETDPLKRIKIQEEVNWIFKEWKPVWDSNTFLLENGFRIIFFDEDHIRIESIITLNSIPFEVGKNWRSLITKLHQKDVFMFQYPYGFITACPSNFGRGNRLSIRNSIPIQDPGANPEFSQFSLKNLDIKSTTDLLERL